LLGWYSHSNIYLPFFSNFPEFLDMIKVCKIVFNSGSDLVIKYSCNGDIFCTSLNKACQPMSTELLLDFKYAIVE
jgi:hypothetical protein